MSKEKYSSSRAIEDTEITDTITMSNEDVVKK
jgi:hypothetical protein